MKEMTQIINCTRFEELLTEYLDKSLDNAANRSVAEHAIACPICHSLLNDVKDSLDVCRNIEPPVRSLTRLEANVIAVTTPESAMICDEFEELLTDYLDGFLPASVFHRWERHAVLCNSCEDMPGMVVRSIAACYTYKMEELPMPAGLHERILESTIGTAQAKEIKPSWSIRVGEWLREIHLPISLPQLAPVAMMLLFAVFFFSQTVSVDGSIAGVYQRSVELAEQTYRQSAGALQGNAPADNDPLLRPDPIDGTIPVSNHE